MQSMKDMLYVNFGQVHRLVTHEDGHFFHAHKVFGVLGLMNFLYRIWNHAVYGDMNYSMSGWTILCIFVHAMMHVTSFEFLIPSRRNRTYNIIWPEMRWHSLVFAYRSLVMMSLLWLSWNGIVSEHLTVWARGPLVIATMLLADTITAHYKRTETLRESETTMRTNPYPSYVHPAVSRMYNLMYSASQVLGTMNILCRDIGSVFLVVFPIQIAPFGMTLVKKGILTQAGWHFWYSIAIFANYWYAKTMVRANDNSLETFYTVSAIFFIIGRFGLNINKYALWCTVIAMQWYLLSIRSDFYQALMDHATNK